MTTEKNGKVIKGLGGLYDVRIEDTDGVNIISCRAKGVLHRDEEKVMIGDFVRVTLDESQTGATVISEIFERKNSLIRPPVSNLDYLFIVFAAKKPTPVLETVDKLIAIAEHNKITPVIVITKSDLSDDISLQYREIYESVGLDVFVTSSHSGEGIEKIKTYIKDNVTGGKTAAFAGASGVGKSTLMNALFEISLATSEISKKIERGRHTTRHVELFEVEGSLGTGFLADTPGFSLVDFARFDFFSLSDLEGAFREFAPYKGRCRYADCAHVGEGEDECEIMRAVKEGKIPRSRHESYKAIYTVLKNKNPYEK